MGTKSSTAIRQFKYFSLAVDEIDSYRATLKPEDRSKDKKLDNLYRRADILLTQLKRLGTI